MKAALVVVVVLGLGLVAGGRANACSLVASPVPIEPRALVADADAAFIGTLLDVRLKNPPVPRSDGTFIVSSADPHVFTYRVEERIKGDLPERVEVVAALGASCGLDGPVGRRTGLILSGAPGAWTSWLGDQVLPETLRRGLLPLPKPDGVGAPAFLGAGHLGSIRTVLLDSRGRPIRYGAGRGAVADVSVCPGGRALVELVARKDGLYVASHSLPGLRLLSERRVAGSGYGRTVVCRDRAGSVSFATVVVTAARTETRLLRVTPIGVRTLERAPELSAAIHGDSAFVSGPNGRLFVRNLRTGARRFVIGTSSPLRGLSVSPDGRRLVGFTNQELVLVDVRTRAVRRVPRQSGRDSATWIGADRVVVAGNGVLATLDSALRPLAAQQDWPAHTTAVTARGPFGVDWQGRLLTIRDGSIHPLGRLFSPAVTVLVPL